MNQKTESKNLPIKFRYFCPHCTERAVYAAQPFVFKNRICQHCGKRISEYDPANWIEITDQEELEKVNS